MLVLDGSKPLQVVMLEDLYAMRTGLTFQYHG